MPGDDVEKRPQTRGEVPEKLTKHKTSNHTEDDTYHPGGTSTPASVTAGIALGAPTSVRKGPFYFNKNLPLYFTHRMKKNYGWARDVALWRDEGTNARSRYLAYQRGRNKERTEARKKVKPSA